MDLGPHAAYIWSAYAMVALTLSGLIGWLCWESRRQRALLEALDRSGVRRRSAEANAKP